MGTSGVRSNWWYAVVAPAALEAAGWAGVLLILGVAGDDNAPIALAPVVLVVIALLLIPVFAFGLFMDARTTRVDSADGGPNPYLWGLVGLLVPIAGLVWTTYSFLIPIAVLYLYRRPPVALASDGLDGTPKPKVRTRSFQSVESRTGGTAWRFRSCCTSCWSHP